MNEKTKTVLLERVFKLNQDIAWNENSLNNLNQELDNIKRVVDGQTKEREALIEDLKAAGVEVDAPVQS